MTPRIEHWIDGAPYAGTSERTAPVHNPATGAVIGEVAMADTADTDHAVARALAAAREWREAPLSRRSAVLFAFRELLNARTDELAAIITAEHGKVLSDAVGEVRRGLENVEFAAGVPQLLKGDRSEQAASGVDVHTVRQPLGVIVGITPFNFPAMVPLWMCAGAIACGNAFVLKPSEKDPSASLFLARLWKEAGLPDGVFTVLQGDREAVDGLLRHPDVAAVSFVGSTPVARHVHATAGAHGKRVQALGGAKNHALVLPDADIPSTADAIVSAAYGSAGERCMALSVAVAVCEAADPLVAALAERLPGLRVGDGTAPDTDMGPLITREHRDRVADYVARGADRGAEVVVDGRKADLPAEGWFLGPTLLDRVTPDMEVWTDEIFGPVLSVVRVAGFEEGMELINSHTYANGTAVFTRDGGAARRFQREVEVGMVGVNVPIPVPVAHHSFGGWKDSLFGDTHMYGPEGIAFCTRAKVVTTRWPDPATSAIDLGFPQTR
ncbi:CoA-acylating methylmalonate-semialdehyde dehydrogenase [Streptomyces alkaliphilus]|uniref:methylmalonate-semialdehyde dehydrogenase (CoA acylating) n=1 Tax=Streptomyces alkaliphilus TaxID=1472722 RepID=A0A7W3TH78_9ACTN|nr:CoA-acylating methylmalonate-semialdehyde dehydrogenase [Streptomyces alkaliphilus]MBB0246465.1 CoA-acylating methylmalonate-semialdehyde dehydrogenase [Streptomyces alkaliphilus]